MKALFQRAVVTTAIPLACAAGALVVREATRAPDAAPAARATARDYLPPPLLLAALARPWKRAELCVDPARSRALIVSCTTSGSRQLAVRGTAHLEADGTLGAVELDLTMPPGARGDGWPPELRLHVRGTATTSRSSRVPGARTSDLRGSLSCGGAVAEGTISAAWLRQPDGTVLVHLVCPLQDLRLDVLPDSPWRMLSRDDACSVGVELVLHAEQ